MKQENSSISIRLSGLYRFFFPIFEKRQSQATGVEPQTDPITARQPQITAGGPVGENEEDKDKDPYLDAYSYLYLYWFI